MRAAAGARPRHRSAVRRARPGVVAALLAVLMLGAVAPAANAAPREGLRLGLMEDGLYQSADSADRALWFDRTVALGADRVSLLAAWHGIAPDPPADPTEPADPAYEWSGLDAAVRDASARGLGVMITISYAPPWAEGPNRDPDADPGTWRPIPSRLAQFARAIATRYSGSFADPSAGGGTLPRVRDWQVWAEPNIFRLLNPQWVRLENGGWRMFSAIHYRKMLNAAYKALKEVSRSNRVISAGTAPFGDPKPGNLRVQPLDFWREVLCLRGKKLRKKKRCPGGPVRADIVAHHPLGIAGRLEPFQHAPLKDDVLIPDMKRLSRVVNKARKRKTLRPRKRTRLWVTEMLWESNPPDWIIGVPPDRHARYLTQSVYKLWQQDVAEVHWVRIQDDPRDIRSTLQSGLYFADGEAKPAAQAFRFPFIALRRRGSRTQVWGRAPASGPVEIQRQANGGWQTAERLPTGRTNVFEGRLDGRATLRAAIAGETSLPYKP